MKQLRYTLEDAHRWARFSGDYNPIHFDLEWVKAHGGTQLSVHGMRALLDAKQLASESLFNQGELVAPYLKCAVRLRHPLWHDDSYDLMVRNKVGSVAILSTSNQQNCLTCQMTPLEHYEFIEHNSAIDIPSDQIMALQYLFSDISAGLYEWQFADAVMFRHLINDGSLLRQKNIAMWLPEGVTLKDIFSHYQVVQTHQEIIFDSRLRVEWMPSTHPDPIKISIQPSLVVGDMLNGLLIGIKTVASYKGKFISNSMTLKISAKAK